MNRTRSRITWWQVLGALLSEAWEMAVDSITWRA